MATNPNEIEYLHCASSSTFIWRKPEVCLRSGVTRRTLDDLVNEGQFPEPILIGRMNGRSVGWISDEVMAWIDNRISMRNAELARRGITSFSVPTT